MDGESGQLFKVQVPGEPRALALVRLVVGHLAELAGLDAVEITKVEIAVDEACTNVLEHAYRDLCPKPGIEVEVRLRPDQMVIDILDRGRSFEAVSYTPPTFPDHWERGNTRGVGLFLIGQCMDEVTHGSRPDGRNQLRLLKKL